MDPPEHALVNHKNVRKQHHPDAVFCRDTLVHRTLFDHFTFLFFVTPDGAGENPLEQKSIYNIKQSNRTVKQAT